MVAQSIIDAEEISSENLPRRGRCWCPHQQPQDFPTGFHE